MNVLLLGSGGREHALADSICKSMKLGAFYIAPGNAGTARLGENVDLNISDNSVVIDFILEKKINLVVVGPEDPLVNGIYDAIKDDSRTAQVAVFGPSKAAAQLEGSKSFAKEFMQRHQIPTASYLKITNENIQEGIQFLESLQAPYVLKADGLAAGKGVIIPETLEEAKAGLSEMLGGQFGAASAEVVIEEYMPGKELSVFVLTDGNSYKILPTAQDYKRIGEGNTGPNTGGMGCISPVPHADEAFMKTVENEVVIPTVEGLKKDGLAYHGVIYCGLMRVGDQAKVVEYNVRFGDPECELLLPRMKSDFLMLCKSIDEGSLDQYNLQMSENAAATVILASGGYPGSYPKGKEIIFKDRFEAQAFFAGVTVSDNKLVTSGGRVIAVTAQAETIKDALNKAYSAVDLIEFEGKTYRTDIGS